VTTAQSDKLAARKPLRLWPGIAAAMLIVLLWLVRFALPSLVPEAMGYSILGGVAAGAVILLWWVLFSRSPWVERVSAILLMIVALAAASRILHPSIATGMMGLMFPIYAIPVLGFALVVWAVASRGLSDRARRATMVATILLACGLWTLLRTNGVSLQAGSDFAWRWSPTAEERLLAHASDSRTAVPPAPAIVKAPEPASIVPAPVVAKAEPVEPAARVPAPAIAKTDIKAAAWPGFRGPRRNDSIPGVRIETDWSKSPPVELWRRPIGPGWSSFAVQGDLLYTQEQRGSDELVTCYSLTTGEPVWKHSDAARFWESNAGAGPRATPTLANGRVYTFGATGIVNALDAGNGAVAWSRNAASDTGAKLPEWGFASSPLVVGGMVVVAASGKLAAYDLSTGEPRWFGPDGGVSYSSPQLATIDGVPQILLLSVAGATSVALADGAQLWKHSWPGYPIVQPGMTADGDVLISVSDKSGMRRLAIAHGAANGPAAWTVEERWTSAGLKPYFNDFVVHNNYAFGFDGSILSCIDLKDGKRKWKGGRYGYGQMVLLPDQDLLVVLSEEGELALVAVTPDQFTELARFPAIEGKTWNHPVLVGDVLLVRNGQEMAAFRLSLAHH
jgi:outer membrane protein assembly factor BamB